MGNLTLNGATSGQITLAPPAVAGTTTINLPAISGGSFVVSDSSGNVGIGTTSPVQKLQVANGNIYFSTTNYLMWDTNGNYGIQSDGSSRLSFFSGSGSERARIDSSGNLLVGTTSQGGSYNGRFVTSTGSGLNGILVKDTQANGAIASFVNSSNALAGTITISGTTTTYGTSSDYRLKENVQPMTTGLATIGALKPVTYDWVSDKSEGEGFIAHELQAVIPHAVTGEKDAVNEDGSIKPQGVDYSKIVVHLVAAMQEQQSIIEDLKDRLAVLEAK